MERISSGIFEDLDAGGTVVVPTASRAAAVEIASARRQLRRGCGAWRTPDVTAYGAWLEREAYRAADAGEPVPRPLRAAEEWLLWREASAAAAHAEGLEAAEFLPDALHRAARVLNDWEISAAALRASARTECRLLASAIASVDARARDLHAVGTHRLAALLRGWRPQCAVTFAGFTEQSAARRTLVRTWLETSGRCREHTPSDAEAGAGEVRAVCAADADEELELAAQWCRARLTDDPGARLLVIVPQLAERRAEALRIFGRTLAPRELLSGDEETPGLLTLESRAPLSEEPVVRHALATLECLLGRAEADTVSAWLRAAFWSAPTAVERATIDARLREIVSVEMTAVMLLGGLRTLSGTLRGPAEQLALALEAALAALQAPEVPVPLGKWAHRFDRALRAVGWPAGNTPDPRERHSAAQFIEVLEDLAAIGARMGSVAAGEALRSLRALAGRRALRLPPSDSAVTLSGALTDPVVRYDGLWIAGVHAEAWPPPAQPDPFIPYAALRRAGVPQANAASRLAQARELLRRLRLATGHLVASWPAHDREGDLLPSPLIAEWGAVTESSQSPATTEHSAALARSIRASRRIETFDDTRGAPWVPAAPLPSGARALEYQSRCAFRAYAELRLASVPLARSRPGVAPFDRGRLLHRALELAWDELASSAGLESAARSGTLARLIESCVTRAAEEALPATGDAAVRAAQRRECRRAVQLLLEFAELERQRPAFRVRSTELRQRIEVEGAALQVRIDRIDELEDGSCALLDYKTGRPAAADWLEERVANPQLLVYALAARSPPTALAMIQLLPRRVAYRGMAERRDRLPKITAPVDAALWPEQVGRWRDLVGRLARDFMQGIARADPLRDACSMCHLQSFCRISEIAPMREAVAAATADPVADSETPRDESGDRRG